MLLAALLLVWAGSGLAQDEGAAPAPEPAAPPAPSLDRTTPRGAVTGYLVAARAGDFTKAASYLDLGPVPAARRKSEGPELARQLKVVLDRTLWVDVEALSKDPAGRQDDGLPTNRDLVGVIDTAQGPVEVFVDRSGRSEQGRVWEISASTVARIPELYDEFGFGKLDQWLPDVMLRDSVFEILLWQWFALLALVPAASILSWLVVRLVQMALQPLVARSDNDLDDQLVGVAAGPLRLGVAVAVFSGGVLALGLAKPPLHFFVALEKALAVLAVTWLLMRLVDIVGALLERRLESRGDTSTAFVPLGRKTIKAAIFALAVLAALDSFGFNVTALIAGLGVGGIAVALAAQKTLENLFGGATLIADRPVKIGDFCRFGDKVGVIEDIGLRSTRVRTLERTLVTVPNAEFATLQLENFAVRDKILFKPRLGLRYETTPDQLRHVLSELKRILVEHPRVDPDPARVRFVGFGSSSLDIDIWAYVTATDFGEYLELCEGLNLQIMDAVTAAGTGFAFPSTTAYLAKDGGTDPDAFRRPPPPQRD